MDFEDEFMNARPLISSFANALSSQKYLPTFLPVPSDIAENFCYVQAYGDIHATYPFSYEIPDLTSYCILLTEKGSGILHRKNSSIILEANSIAFVDCHDKYRLEIGHAPWVFKQLFISGPSVSYFYHTFSGFCESTHTIFYGPALPVKVKTLFEYLTKTPQKALLHTKYLSEILFELLIQNDRTSEKICYTYNYIYDIKKDLDKDYLNNDITLESLERRYHVSKYRICREFTLHFKISPIQYLYHNKIETAKKELRQTDKKINEIGRLIGFDNTNNFIRQFKKQTGLTPLVYRKQHYTG